MQKIDPIYVHGTECQSIISTKYISTKKRRRFTVCGILKDDGYLNIGISICSNDDIFVKKTGREIALAKAQAETWKVKISTDRIKKIIKFLNLISDFISFNLDEYKHIIKKEKIDETLDLPF